MFCGLTITFTLVAVGSIIFGIIYSLGRSYAKTAINDSDIVFSMDIYDPTNTGFSVHIVGSIDNRNILDATLFPTTISLGCRGKVYGTMAFPEIHLTGGALTPLDLNLTVVVTDVDAFNTFTVDLMQNETVTMTMYSHVNVQAAGMRYNSIEFNKEMTVLGMGGFTDPPCQVLNQIIFEGDPTTLYIALNVSMDNRSPVSIASMGQLNLSMTVDGVPVGFAISDGPFHMAPGLSVSNWITTIIRGPDNHDQINALVGSYARGGLQNVTLHGHANSTNITSLQYAVSQMVINTTLQGLTHKEDKLIQVVYTSMHILNTPTDPVQCAYNDTTPATGQSYQDVYMYIHNPFAAPILMNNVDFNVWWTDTEPYTFLAHARARNLNQTVPPGGTVVQTQRLCLTEDVLGFGLKLMTYMSAHNIDSTGVVPWDMGSLVNGTIQGGMEAFATDFNYTQVFTTVARTSLT